MNENLKIKRIVEEDTETLSQKPFSVVRRVIFYKCRCDPRLLNGESALRVMYLLKQVSATSGFTVIGEHYDLYGTRWEEMSVNGWTVNLSYSQSGMSGDAWHHLGTIDFNMHWCHEEGPDGSDPQGLIAERAIWPLLEAVFKPTAARYKGRNYVSLEYKEEAFKKACA